MDESSSTYVDAFFENTTTLVDLDNVIGQSGGDIFVPSETFVSSVVLEMIEYVIEFSLISLICLIGMVGNSVTLVVFYRQGYRETINISLTAIAIWDLIKCVCGAIYRTRVPMQAVSPAFSFTYSSIVSFGFGYNSFYCTYASAILAAYVAVERCLCVSLPFTVKYLLTPKVVTSVMLLLSVLSYGSVASIAFGIERIVWVHHPVFNETVAMESFTSVVSNYEDYLNAFNILGNIWIMASLAIQCTCTLIISYHLRKASQFRSSVAATNSNSKDIRPNDVMSRRDRQVTKMLLVVIVIYIVNIFPNVVINIAKSVEPEFYMFRIYHNLFASCYIFQNLFDFLNSAVNPLIYFLMSSQYKNSIIEMFCSRKA